jgi:hypothetical protein
MTATESATHMAATEAAAHMAAATTEAAAHVAATATATVSSPTTATSPAARKRVSSQSPSESGNHSQSDRGLTQHCTYSFGRDRVHLTENTVTTVRFDCANPIDDYAARRSATFSNRYARYCRSGKPARHATRILSQILTDKSALTFSSDGTTFASFGPRGAEMIAGIRRRILVVESDSQTRVVKRKAMGFFI